ncbi:MAG TPA: DUF5666 domain-containing protein [Candidatus Lustribacter sp.]|jgi:hypothetical protein|nr:DUF5666 domain-containing protein [Candidatus Lustribacter sp.]
MMKKLLIAGLAALMLPVAALAQNAPATAPAPTVNIRGVVVSLAGNVLTVGAPMGPATTTVTLAPNYKVQYIVATTLAAITPGSYVGSAALPGPNGTLRAIEVHVFPPGVTGRLFSSPFDLGPTSTMTNGNVQKIGTTKVDNVSANTITVQIDNGEKTLVVTPDTPIVTYAPADASAIVKGAHVNVRATKNPDGSLTAAGVNVGKDGLVPPM